MAIESFKDKLTETINKGEVTSQTTKLLPRELHKKAMIRLAALGAATSTRDLAMIRGKPFRGVKRQPQRSMQYQELTINIAFALYGAIITPMMWKLPIIIKEINMSYVTAIHPGAV